MTTTSTIKPVASQAASAPGSTTPSPSEQALYSHESERLAISIMMDANRNTLHHSLMSLLSYEDFYVEQHQVIWKIIAAMREAGVSSDPVSIIDHANAKNEFVGGSIYIVDTFNDPVARLCKDESVTAAANRIKGFSMTRKMQRILNMSQALNNTGQKFDVVSSFVEDEIVNLKRLSSSSRSGPKQVAYFYDAIMARIIAKSEGEEVETGIPTHFPELDRVLGGGLCEGLIVLAGRPGMGKTAFATAIEQNISNGGRPTLFFSLEMSGVALAQRNLSRHSRIPFSHIRTAEIEEHEFAPLLESLEILTKAPCYIDETPGLSISEVRARGRAFIQQFPNGVIFLDYVQIVQPGHNGKGKDPRAVVTETSQGLVQLARELKCPIVALAQLSRELEKRASKRPIISDLKESGQIEQDASIIMFVYRDEVYNKDTRYGGTTEVIIGKNRDGECDTIQYMSDLSRMSYSEMGRFDGEGL